MCKTIKELMDEKPMVGFQWRVIALCFLINMLDGFDVLVMAFTAVSVSAHWSLNGTQLGYLLSAGFVGMAVGSLFIAPWADRFGRRPLILTCVSIAGSGMLLSAYASSPEILALLRFLTGLGIGGLLASSYVIAGEYASKRWRGLAISLQATGYTLGATVGGLITAQVISSLGWQAVFQYGGIITLLTLPILLIGLPESLDFLVSRQPTAALERINRLLKKVQLPPLASLPLTSSATQPKMRASFKALLSTEMLRKTLLIWVAFFLVMFGFYFVMSWTPRLMVSSGLSQEQGITAGVMLNVGGILGTSLIGLLAVRFRLSRVLAGYLLTSALLLIVFVGVIQELRLAFVLAVVIGLFVSGSMAGLYALTPAVYDATHRVTGLGWAIGIGRAGAIISPLMVGRLIDAQWQPVELFVAFSLTFILAAVAVVALRPSAPGQSPVTSQVSTSS